MRRCKLIMFDVGGVLLSYDHTKVVSALQQKMSPRPPFIELNMHILRSSILLGAQTPEELHGEMQQRYHYRGSFAEWLHVWNGQFQPIQPMLDALKSLRVEFKLAICSNTNAAHWNFIEQRYRLADAVDSVTVSHRVGLAKPHPEIYAHALRAAASQPSDCLFVDDTAANVTAARASGLTAHHFTGIDGFHEALVKFRTQAKRHNDADT